MGDFDDPQNSGRMTIHHNWWPVPDPDIGTTARTPFLRMNRTHLLNNYWTSQYAVVAQGNVDVGGDWLDSLHIFEEGSYKSSTVGLGGAMPFVSAFTTGMTGVFLGEADHLGWSVVGAILGFLGGLTLYSIYGGVFDQPFQLGLALGFIFTGNVAGSVLGYHFARHRSQRAGRALSLELLRGPAGFLEKEPSQINGFILNWNFRF